MQFASYKVLCATPATQADFLERTASLLDPIPTNGENWMRREALTKIEVGGHPFSISKYLATLEMSSQDWDIDEDDLELHRFVGAAKTMAIVHPELDVPAFTFAFHAMPGADMPPPSPTRHLESNVTTHIIGTPGLGGSVLSGAARVNVVTQVRDEGARRMMRPR